MRKARGVAGVEVVAEHALSAWCPRCGKRLVRRGGEKAVHWAHRPGEACREGEQVRGGKGGGLQEGLWEEERSEAEEAGFPDF